MDHMHRLLFLFRKDFRMEFYRFWRTVKSMNPATSEELRRVKRAERLLVELCELLDDSILALDAARSRR